APLPLLVFDKDTFATLGDIDEGFLLQGGIADWMSRAHHISGRVKCATKGDSNDSRMGESARWREGKDAALDSIHWHSWVWEEQFISAYQPVEKWEDVVQNGNRREGLGDASFFLQDNARGEEERSSVVDALTTVQPRELSMLAQMDIDLYFLQLLTVGEVELVPPQPFPLSHPTIVAALVDFHSQWMGRGPDAMLLEARERQTQMPVAAVVLVHDDFFFMSWTVEEVAMVVEHILILVSTTPWHGEAGDIGRTLETLQDMEADPSSPAYGKMRVIVGAWRTEEEQREYGSQEIRTSARDFKRVLVLDTDEFWHPVQLAKALILASKYPSTPYIQATMSTYWASIRTIVTPPEPLRILWLMDPHRCKWYLNRELECEGGGTEGNTVQEGLGRDMELERVTVDLGMDYVRTDKEVQRKIRSFAHAADIQADWYKRSWVGWANNNSLTNLHPTHPSAYFRTVFQPLLYLTPALRRLHLSSRKGQWPGTKGKCLRGSGAWQSPGQEGYCWMDDVNPQEDEGVGKMRLRTRKQADESREDRGKVKRGEGVNGCEQLHPTAWTEWQRMLCLVPDSKSFLDPLCDDLLLQHQRVGSDCQKVWESPKNDYGSDEEAMA
ncbi:unnamed protein product, partial [Choristocarpus tenellus]